MQQLVVSGQKRRSELGNAARLSSKKSTSRKERGAQENGLPESQL